MRRYGIVFILCCAASLSASALVGESSAKAQSRYVGVLSIRGPGAKGVRRFLESQIDKRWNLVTRNDLKEASEDLGISGKKMTNRRNLRRIARKARADAVVTGYVFRSRRRWWLSIQVYDGASGRVVSRGSLLFAFFRLNKWSKRSVLKILVRGVRKARGVPHRRRRAVEPDDRPARPIKVVKKKKPLGQRPSWMTAIHAGVGIQVWGRRLSFNNLALDDSQPDVQVPGRHLLYETNSPVVPIAFYVEGFPGAFATRHKVLANVGLGFRFARAIGVVSQREGETTRIETTIQRVGGYLLYRWNVSQTALSPELRFSLGVGVVEYSFGEDLGKVAGVLYMSFRPGIKAIFPLGTPRVRLSLITAGMVVLQLGQIADAYHYGSARAGGIEAGLEVDVRLFWHLHLVAGVNTTWFFVSFAQTGVRGLDFEFRADSALDGYYGGYLLMAIHY